MTGTGRDRRFVAIATLVVAALLGSAYAVGRSLVPEPTGTSARTPASTEQPPTDGTDRSPGRGDTAGSPTPSASASGAEIPGLETAMDGPFGTQVTTGSTNVALTFDDGPDPQYTPQVLELLRQFRVKATFCVVGEMAQGHPDLVRAIVSEGHTLCNHSWNHDVELGQRSPATIRDDLQRTNAAIREAVPNARVAYYRQPGGAWTEPVVSVADELGLVPLHWSVDPTDWEMPGASVIASFVAANTQPGAIVLMHDAGGDRQGTVNALQTILPDLTSRFQLAALPAGTT
ncbi:polysaccharide deacetylase family protein [Micromonospora olivasterospora]|uniref:Polysaccharide deacetylase n=1 Tax=Micromonospora olivasterospora TaxID=1880 RepID=A0A562I733_MICOL|nr:polysaccharide deacetylase family protein [Micromonospora olivasterospora]TWH66821.1 polysaccharide deacetylase [Micromonospora olivasterospora]